MISPGLVVLLTLTVLGAPGALAGALTTYFYNLTLNVGPSPSVTTPIQASVTICFNVDMETSTMALEWGPTIDPSIPDVNHFKATTQADLKPDTVANPVQVSKVDVDADQGVVTLTFSNTLSIGSYVNITIAYNITPSSGPHHKGVFLLRTTNTDNTVSTILGTNLRTGYAHNLFPSWGPSSGGMNFTMMRPSIWQTAASLSRASLREDPSSKISYDCFITTKSFSPSSLSFFLTSDMTEITTSLPLASPTTIHMWSAPDTNTNLLKANINSLAMVWNAMERLFRAYTVPNVHIVCVRNLPTPPIFGDGIIFIRDSDYTTSAYGSAQSEGLFKTTLLPLWDALLSQFTQSIAKAWSDAWMTAAINKFAMPQLMISSQVGLNSSMSLAAEFIEDNILKALFLDTSTVDTYGPVYSTAIDDLTHAGIEAALMDPLRISKGAALLTMLDQSFPEGSVLTTISHILKQRIENQALASTTDFCSEFSSVVRSSGSYSPPSQTAALQDLGQWFRLTCPPLVNVTDLVAGDPGSFQLKLAQLPGCSLPPDGLYVAVTASSKSEPRLNTPAQNIWVSSAASTQGSITLATDSWLVLNYLGYGYYTVSYPAEDLERIMVDMASASGEVPNPGRLVTDSAILSFMGAGRHSFNTIWRLALANLRAKNLGASSAVWNSMKGALNEVRDRFWKQPSLYTDYKNYAKSYLETVANMLKNSTLQDREAARVTGLFYRDFCELNVADYRTTAKDHLTNLLNGNLPKTLPSSTYEPLVCCGAQQSSLSVQDLWTKMSATSSGYYEKHFKAVAIGCTSNYTILSSMYSTMLAADPALGPYILTMFRAIAEEHPTDFINSVTFYAPKLQEVLGAAQLATLIATAARKINTNEQAAVLNDLTKSAAVDAVVKQAATNTIATAAARVSWLTNFNVTLATSLRDNQLPSGDISAATRTTLLSLSLLVLLATTLSVEHTL